jgi:hypothetical protein
MLCCLCCHQLPPTNEWYSQVAASPTTDVLPPMGHHPPGTSGRPLPSIPSNQTSKQTLHASASTIATAAASFASSSHQSTGFTPTATPLSATPPGSSRAVSHNSTSYPHVPHTPSMGGFQPSLTLIPSSPSPVAVTAAMSGISSQSGTNSTNTMAITGPSLPAVSHQSATPLSSIRTRVSNGSSIAIRPLNNSEISASPSSLLTKWGSLRSINNISIHPIHHNTNNHNINNNINNNNSESSSNSETGQSDIRKPALGRARSSRGLEIIPVPPIGVPSPSPSSASISGSSPPRRDPRHDSSVIVSPGTIFVHSALPPVDPDLSIDPAIDEENKHEGPISPKIIVTPSANGSTEHLKTFHMNGSVYPDDNGNLTPMTPQPSHAPSLSRKNSRRSRSRVKRQGSKRGGGTGGGSDGSKRDLLSTTESFRESVAGTLSTTTSRRSRSRSKTRSSLLSGSSASTRAPRTLGGIVLPKGSAAAPDLSQRRGSLFRNETLSHHQWEYVYHSFQLLSSSPPLFQ